MMLFCKTLGVALQMVLLNSTGRSLVSARVSDSWCNITPERGILEHHIFNSVLKLMIILVQMSSLQVLYNNACKKFEALFTK